MNFTLFCLVFGAFLGITLAYAGQYVPKSFYVIDHLGHKSEPVYLRNKREIMQNYIRQKRSDTGSSASSHSSAQASSSAGGGSYGGVGGANPCHDCGGGGGYSSGSSDNAPHWFRNNLGHFYQPYYFYLPYFQPYYQFRPYYRPGSQAGSGGRGQAFASSFSSASSGNGQGGFGSGQGGLGSGHDAGYSGSGNIPTLFSRFGETQGSGIHVSGSAQGQKGAFSSSSSSIDSDGKIKYSVQSGKL